MITRERNTEAVRRWRAKHPERFKAYGDKYKATYPEQLILTRLKYSSKKRGLPCTLTVDDLKRMPIPAVCPVLNIPLKRGKGNISDNSPSLDRIDNLKGYELGNVMWVSWRANKLKHCATFEEMEKIYLFHKQLKEKK